MPNEYIYESKLSVDNVEVSPVVQGLLNITYAFAMPKTHAALISISDGSNTCPVTYRWIVLSKKGYKVSPAFGSCSSSVTVSVMGRTYTLKTPNPKNPDKIDVYVYDGKTIKYRLK